MTEYEAKERAKLNKYYRAKQDRAGCWGVWCDKAMHWVEFDQAASPLQVERQQTGAASRPL